MNDAPVPELDEMIDDRADTRASAGADDIQRRRGDTRLPTTTVGSLLPDRR